MGMDGEELTPSEFAVPTSKVWLRMCRGSPIWIIAFTGLMLVWNGEARRKGMV